MRLLDGGGMIGILHPVARPLAAPFGSALAARAFSWRNLFADGTPGFRINIEEALRINAAAGGDLTKCVAFQDSAGTLPVTAMEQQIGLILDTKLGVPAAGADVKNIALGATWTESDGVYTNTGTAYGSFLTLASGVSASAATYEVIVEVLSGSINIYNATSGSAVATFTVGTRRSIIISGGSPRAAGSLGASLRVTSVREVPGNHFVQPSNTASRPVVSRRVNLLTATTSYPALFTSGAHGFWTAGAGVDGSDQYEFASGTQTNWAVQTVTPNTSYVFSQDVALGTATAAAYAIYDQTNSAWIVDTTAYTGLSAALQRKSVQFTTPANCTAIRIYPVRYIVGALGTAFFRNPDLRLSIDANLPPYQRVTSATDYDESGFPAYAKFDGVDDWLESGVVDMTSTDEVTVLAGVTKLSDAASAIAVEFSKDVGTNNGAFAIAAPSANGSNSYRASSRGTATNHVGSGVFAPAPDKALVGLIGKISAPSVTLRRNGVQVATSTVSQGTGNYGAHKFYMGRRGGTTLPFNGRIYGVTVVGKLLTDSQLAAAEQAERNLGRLY
jgi:hypothetical protein